MSLPSSFSIRPVAARYSSTSRTCVPICVPYAPAFMRNAPPMLPGTPIKPSIPPKSRFAQNVTVPPKSAAASTYATVPSTCIPGCDVGKCSTTKLNSPSATSKFDPPPKNLCRMPSCFKRRITSGIVSNFLKFSWSVVPPIPSDVLSTSETPGINSTPSSASCTAIGRSLIRMGLRELCVQPRRQRIQRAIHVARANRQHHVSQPRFPQHEFHPRIHRVRVDHVLVSGEADRFRKPLAVRSRDRVFACRVNIEHHEHICIVE